MQPEFDLTISNLKEELYKVLKDPLYIVIIFTFIMSLNHINLEYLFKYIKSFFIYSNQVSLSKVKPLEANISSRGLPLILYDSMGQSCTNLDLDDKRMKIELEPGRKIKVNDLKRLGFLYVPGADIMQFNPILDISNNMLDAMSKKSVGVSAVYQHIKDTDYAL